MGRNSRILKNTRILRYMPLANMYKMTIKWAHHPRATLVLAILSFIESIISPIPPDVILAPMSIAQPKLAWHYAIVAAGCSVIGGICGYCLGYFLLEVIIYPYILLFNYLELYQAALQLFNKWGMFAILIAGITPIPYKIFTIGAGALKFSLPNFIIASIIGRSTRFFLLSALMKYKGQTIDRYVNKFLNKHNYQIFAIITILILLYAFYKFYKC